jgi:selenocysteine lyase/cysteine desulfurase
MVGAKEAPMVGWSRRDVLLASGALGGAAAIGAITGCSPGDGSSDGSSGQPEVEGRNGDGAFDPSDWASVREQFPLSPDLRHFAAFVLAAHPRPVAEAIERHRRGLDEDPEGYLAAEEESNEIAVRQAASRYLGGSPEQVALTDSTTMGLGLVYGGLRITARDEVLTTEHDFYSTHEALRLRSERTGCTVRRVRLYDDDNPASANAGQMVERIVDAVSPSTRVVALTWVHSGTGVKVPVADVARALDSRSASRGDPILLCVDAVHGLGAEDTSPDDLGCDFLISGTHKWLFGPRGTGIVWGRNEAWGRFDAIVPPFEPASYTAWIEGQAPDRSNPGLWATPGGFHSFEHRWALAQAFEFHLEIGKEAVTERIRSQATQLKEGLAELPGVEVVTPLDPALSSGIVCASVGGRDATEAVARLRDQGIGASVTPYRQPYLRFGPGIVTTPEDVDALIEAVAGLT